ncbi:unnamed protein product [Ectocarpus sp. CCAP 1310/34]|nr:unnamed protein product [Ectocarpus sp. CCAP 1310/34]
MAAGCSVHAQGGGYSASLSGWPCERRVTPTAVISTSGCWRLLFSALLLAVGTGDAQNDDQSYAEDGTERGPNSKVAKEAEMYMPLALGGLIVLVVICFCCYKLCAARSRVHGEEANIDDVEARFQAAEDEKRAAIAGGGGQRGNDSRKLRSHGRDATPSAGGREDGSHPARGQAAAIAWEKTPSDWTVATSMGSSSRDDLSSSQGGQVPSVASAGSSIAGGSHRTAKKQQRRPSSKSPRTSTKPSSDGGTTSASPRRVERVVEGVTHVAGTKREVGSREVLGKGRSSEASRIARRRDFQEEGPEEHLSRTCTNSNRGGNGSTNSKP